MEGVSLTAQHAARAKNKILKCNETGKITQSPLVSRLYYYRARCMHLLSTACAQALSGFNSISSPRSGPNIISSSNSGFQVLVLGAGVDSKLEQNFANYTDTKIFVVDFANVLDTRGPKEHEIQVTADLRDTEALKTALTKAGFDFSASSVVVLECVACYLSPAKVSSLMSFISENLPETILIISFDPIFPVSTSDLCCGYIQDMRSQFDQRGAPILFSCDDTKSYADFMREAGIEHVFCATLGEMMFAFGEDHGHDVFSEPFDEYHGLALLMRNYSVSLASNSEHIFSNALLEGLFTAHIPQGYDMTIMEARRSELRAKNYADEIDFRQRVNKNYTSHSSLDCHAITKIPIRPATTADLSEVLNLYTCCFVHVASKYKCVHKFMTVAKKDIVKMVKKTSQETELESDYTSFVWVIEIKGKIAGFVGLELHNIKNSVNYELKHMCVNESWRGKGMGQRLIMHVIDKVHCHMTICKIKSSVIHLSCIHDLQHALCLYNKVGFREIKKSLLGDGCVLCHLQLTIP